MSPTKFEVITTKLGQKCRCCTFPSTKFLELDSVSKACGADKTYKDVLYDVANIKVSNINK